MCVQQYLHWCVCVCVSKGAHHLHLKDAARHPTQRCVLVGALLHRRTSPKQSSSGLQAAQANATGGAPAAAAGAVGRESPGRLRMSTNSLMLAEMRRSSNKAPGVVGGKGERAHTHEGACTSTVFESTPAVHTCSHMCAMCRCRCLCVSTLSVLVCWCVN